MRAEQTMCLGHHISTDEPNGCPRANECALHLALRSRRFPDQFPITGAACASMDYVLFTPVEEVTA